MSVVRQEMVENVAESMGVDNLLPDAASALATEVEFLMRSIINLSSKFQAAAKRPTLTSNDINASLSTYKLELLYGITNSSSFNITKTPDNEVLYIPNDPVVSLTDVVMKNSFDQSKNTGVKMNMHWLAVNGIIPAIPENDTSFDNGSSSLAMPTTTAQQQKESEKSIKHVLSDSMVSYYETITAGIESPDSSTLPAIYNSLATSSGLSQILPYLITYFYDQVKLNLSTNVSRLETIVSCIKCLLLNHANLNLQLYLHFILPAVLSCLVGKTPQINSNLKLSAAQVLRTICDLYGSSTYSNMIPRVLKTLDKALMDDESPQEVVGAIYGITLLGPRAIETLLLPKINKLTDHSVVDVVDQAIKYAVGMYVRQRASNYYNEDLAQDFGESLVPYYTSSTSSSSSLKLLI